MQYEKSQKKVKGISTIKHRGAIREITEKSEGVNTIKHRGVVREITEKGGTVWKPQRS